MGINTLSMAHDFIRRHVPEGGLCIDATMGRGRDTALLCRLVGERGRVIAFDLQPQALESTAALLAAEGLSARAELHCLSHHRMAEFAVPESVDCIVFNFGWLPGGSHELFTLPETSIPAIQAGLELLKPGGVMSLCIYYGGRSGYGERDALLEFLPMLDNRRFTVVVSRFVNRDGDVPIPVFILKEG